MKRSKKRNETTPDSSACLTCPPAVGVDKNTHFNNVCTALNLFAPGCLAQNKGRYFFLKADVLLSAIRGENSEVVETEDVTDVSEGKCPF